MNRHSKGYLSWKFQVSICYICHYILLGSSCNKLFTGTLCCFLERLSMLYRKCNQILICTLPGHITDGKFSRNGKIIIQNIAHLVACNECRQKLLCFKMIEKFKLGTWINISYMPIIGQCTTVLSEVANDFVPPIGKGPSPFLDCWCTSSLRETNDSIDRLAPCRC